jgi:hypothetical protein
MSGHHHNHNHGPGGHCHDEHSHDDDLTPAVQHSLHPHINFDAIRSLNEAAPGQGKAVVRKGWDQRLTETPVLESDADEQLLITIPYVLPNSHLQFISILTLNLWTMILTDVCSF